jgi:hypothetical protein
LVVDHVLVFKQIRKSNVVEYDILDRWIFDERVGYVEFVDVGAQRHIYRRIVVVVVDCRHVVEHVRKIVTNGMYPDKRVLL